MKLHIERINEKRRLVVGTVKSVTSGSEGKVMNVKLEGTVWDQDEKRERNEVLDIAFWNNDTVKMADRITAAKVKEGSVISVDIYENDGKITGNNFRYNGHWIIPATETKKEKNIFHGVVSSMKTDDDGRYVRVSMPINGKSDEEPTWVSMTFWNNEDSNIAERAKKCLGKRKSTNGDGETVERSARAIIICGEKKEYNGREQYSAFDFILID